MRYIRDLGIAVLIAALASIKWGFWFAVVIGCCLVIAALVLEKWKQRRRQEAQAPAKGTPMSRRIARQMAETIEFGLTKSGEEAAQWTFKVETGPCELVASNPDPRHQVYLSVTNDGVASRFSAQVVGVSGSVTYPATPWTIPWRESSEQERTIHTGATELLSLLEVIPMGEDPQRDLKPGLMIARNSAGAEMRMRIVADGLSSLYVNSLGLDISVVNVDSGERQKYYIGIGLENATTIPPRLRIVGPT